MKKPFDAPRRSGNKRFRLMLSALLPAFLMMLSIGKASAQTMVDEIPTWAGSWKYAFSEEGRKDWKPEFTARLNVQFVMQEWTLSGGVRIDEKRTLGLMVGNGMIYNDAEPKDLYYVSAGAYMRRYFHTKSRTFSFYADLWAGAAYFYKDTGSYQRDPDSGVLEKAPSEKGTFAPAIYLQPGVRFRFWRNVHIFLGPTISTGTFGVHLGAGF